MVKHSANYWRFIIDGDQVDSVSEPAVCWMPRSSVWFGESWDYGDQIGGTSSSRYFVTATQYMTIEGGGWNNTSFNSSASCNYAPTSPPFYCDIININRFEIWTNR